MSTSIPEEISSRLGVILKELPQEQRTSIKRGRFWKVLSDTQETIQHSTLPETTKTKLLTACDSLQGKIFSEIDIDPEVCYQKVLRGKVSSSGPLDNPFLRWGVQFVLWGSSGQTPQCDPQKTGLPKDLASSIPTVTKNLIQEFCKLLRKYDHSTEEPPELMKMFFVKADEYWELNSTGSFFRRQLLSWDTPPQIIEREVDKLNNLILLNLYSVLAGLKEGSEKEAELPLPPPGEGLDPLELASSNLSEGLLSLFFPHGSCDIIIPYTLGMASGNVHSKLKKGIHEAIKAGLVKWQQSIQPTDYVKGEEGTAKDNPLSHIVDTTLSDHLPLYENVAATLLANAIPKKPFEAKRDTLRMSLEKEGFEQADTASKTALILLEKVSSLLSSYDNKSEQPPKTLSKLFHKSNGNYHLNGFGKLVVRILQNNTCKEILSIYLETVILTLANNLCSQLKEGKFPEPPNAESLTEWALNNIILKNIPLPPLLEPLRPLLADLAVAPIKEQVNLLLSASATIPPQKTEKSLLSLLGLFSEGKDQTLFKDSDLNLFTIGLGRLFLKKALEMPGEKALVSPEKNLFQNFSDSLLPFFKKLLSQSYSKENPPPKFLSRFFREAGDQFVPKISCKLLVTLLSDKECCSTISAFATDLFYQMFLILKQNMDEGKLTLPPEVLNPTAPDRAKRVSEFLLNYAMKDKEPPLPPLLEPFREAIPKIFAKVIEKKIGDLLIKADDFLSPTQHPTQIETVPPIDLSALKPSLDPIVKIITTTLMTGTVKGKHLLSINQRIEKEKSQLLNYGFEQAAIAYLEKQIDELIELKFPNQKELAPLLKANVFVILSKLCTLKRDATTFQKLKTALDTARKAVITSPEKGEETDPLATLAPLLTKTLRTLLPEDLELPFVPEELRKQVNNLLDHLLFRGIAFGLKTIEKKLPAFLEKKEEGGQGILGRIGRALFDRLKQIKEKRQYPKKEAKDLAHSMFMFIKILLPEGIKLPEFLIKAVIVKAIPFAEIPTGKILNSLLLAAQDQSVSIKTFLEKPAKTQEAMQIFNLEKTTTREFVRALIGAQKKEIKDKLKAPRSKTGEKVKSPDTAGKEVATFTFLNRLELRLKLFAFTILGLVIPLWVSEKSQLKNVSGKAVKNIGALKEKLKAESLSQ